MNYILHFRIDHFMSTHFTLRLFFGKQRPAWYDTRTLDNPAGPDRTWGSLVGQLSHALLTLDLPHIRVRAGVFDEQLQRQFPLILFLVLGHQVVRRMFKFDECLAALSIALVVLRCECHQGLDSFES